MGPFPAVRWQRRAQGGPAYRAARAGKMFCPRPKEGSAGAAATKGSGKGAPAEPAPKKAADQQKISARPDQRPGCGNDRAAQADQAGIGTNRSPDTTAGRPGIPFRTRGTQHPAAIAWQPGARPPPQLTRGRVAAGLATRLLTHPGEQMETCRTALAQDHRCTGRSRPSVQCDRPCSGGHAA